MRLKKPKLFIYILIPALGLSLMAFHFKSAPQYTLITKIPLQGGAFITDNLQNAYVYGGDVLKKYDATGKLLYRYEDKSYGSITYIDVTDPLKVMVFYKDFPEIVLLDNTLSLNGSPISPANLGYQLTTLACISNNNGAWIYDAQGVQLVRLDAALNVTQKTGNLVQSVGVPINPDYLLEYNNFLYLNDSAQGILVFDKFGTYFKTIPIKHLSSFEIRGNDMFYNQGNAIHAFHLKEILEDVTAAPDSVVKLVRIEKNILFESCADTLRVYQVK